MLFWSAFKISVTIGRRKRITTIIITSTKTGHLKREHIGMHIAIRHPIQICAIETNGMPHIL